MQLMWEVDHELQRVSKRMGRSLGVTGPQRLALLFIGQSPGMSAGDLARSLHLDPGTLTGIIRRLEEARLVLRTTDEQDGRRARLSLTEKGRAANRRRSATVETAVRRALGGIPSGDLAAARRTLTRVAAELQRVASA